MLLLVAALLTSQAQEPAPGAATAAKPARLVFHFEHPGLAVPDYTFTLLDSGDGVYQAGHAAAAPLRLMQATYVSLFQQIRTANAFRGCSSRAQNLANTGTKTLTYSDAAGQKTCTYNYSDSKVVTALTDTFENMEYVLEAGARLEHDRRFDRLGLDQEMRDLVKAAHEGRTAGLANIAPTLKAIIDDPLLLERVRASAAQLMDQGSAGK